jgi:Zn-dependent M28 family amino/carboxypeptidase
VVVVGAHLDSVVPGPGINDNGSGSATILEVARQLAKFKTTNRVRFAWWGAEELNLIGSTNYVNGLSPAQKDAIALNLNFDMVGSPNFVRFVYDSDNSAFPPGPGGAQPGPPGSGAIEQTFTDYFASQNLASDPTPFNGRSDYGPFITTTSPAHPAGIPAGGLFTGAEGVKTAEQAAVYGGTAGVAYDPLLPPGLRHLRQQQRHRPEPDVGRPRSGHLGQQPTPSRRHGRGRARHRPPADPAGDKARRLT